MNTILTQVHLIATDKLAAHNMGDKCLFLNHKGKLIHYLQAISATIIQHLYLTSSEEAKEGDWCIDVSGEQIFKMGGALKTYPKGSDLIKGILENAKKIIATTNPELWPRAWNDNKNTNSLHIFGDEIVHKIPDSFIQDYIKAYNEGNQIKEVLLESEPAAIHKGRIHTTSYGNILKLDFSGCVIIHPKEEKRFTEADMEASFAEGVNVGKLINELPTPRMRFKEFMKKY